MSGVGPVRRPIIRFNWRLLLLTRFVIVVAALLAAIVVTRIWQTPLKPTHIYAVADIALSCVAVSRLRKAGWVFVGIHLLVAILWCELAWNLPSRWFQ